MEKYYYYIADLLPDLFLPSTAMSSWDGHLVWYHYLVPNDNLGIASAVTLLYCYSSKKEPN